MTNDLEPQYKDLKELKPEDWDGKPFQGITTDWVEGVIPIDERFMLEGTRHAYTIHGYVNNGWVVDGDIRNHWKHAYKIEDNKH